MSSEKLTIWCVSIVLTKNEYHAGSTTQQIAQSVSWRSGVTKEAATGAAIEYAMKAYPGFGVVMITPSEIEVPLSALANTEASRGT